MNIQNLPRKEKMVKRAFIPKLDCLLFADYDQIEMRVLAYYMAKLGDDSMVRVLKSAGDLHTESARAALRIADGRPLTDEERQVGKTFNFSLVYGGGRPTLVRQLGCTFPEATRMLKDFHARWPGIARVQAALELTYAERGYLKTVAGARLHPEKKHALLNAVVQSSAAEVMREALRRCHRELNVMHGGDRALSHLVCVVHDELVFDVYEPEKADIVSMLPTWMDYPLIGEIVPVTVSLEHSYTNWADKEPLGV